MTDIDFKKFKNKPLKKDIKTKNGNKYKLFIKGPIPVWWFSEANRLAPSASQVGLVLWHLAGMKKSMTVVLTNKKLKQFNLSRKKKYLGLESLEKAGLIEVRYRTKQNPIVTIITVLSDEFQKKK